MSSDRNSRISSAASWVSRESNPLIASSTTSILLGAASQFTGKPGSSMTPIAIAVVKPTSAGNDKNTERPSTILTLSLLSDGVALENASSSRTSNLRVLTNKGKNSS